MASTDSSGSFFFETPPSNQKTVPRQNSSNNDDDDVIIQESSSSVTSAHSSDVIRSSSSSDISASDDADKENLDKDAAVVTKGDSFESQSSSTPLPTAKRAALGKFALLDITAMEPLDNHRHLNMSFGASAAKPPVQSVGKAKKSAYARILPMDDSSDEENEKVTAIDSSSCSDERKEINASPEAETNHVHNGEVKNVSGYHWKEPSTEDIEKDLNDYLSDDDELDALVNDISAVRIASNVSSDKTLRASGSKSSVPDPKSLFAKPGSSSSTVGTSSNKDSASQGTSGAYNGFNFKEKNTVPEVHDVDSESDRTLEIESGDESVPSGADLADEERRRSASSSKSSSAAVRKQSGTESANGYGELNSFYASSASSDNRNSGRAESSQSQADTGVAGSSRPFAFKPKTNVAPVYTVDSDSDSPIEIETDFENLQITEKEVLPRVPKKEEGTKRTIYLPDLPQSSQSVPVPSSSRGPAKVFDATTSLLAVDKCIRKLTEEFEKAPKETEERGPKPDILKVDLHPHQEFALDWLSWRENESPFGGILADEMGLGKTVMMLALICRGKEAGSNPDDGWKSKVGTERKLLMSESTLVVCPASVMGQWESEVKSKSSRLKVNLWHGANREKNATKIAKHDIVITSYNTLSSEIPKESEQLVCHSPLLKINWKRVILDEGHVIRNHMTTMSQAACRLIARHRWLVTGTPIHNKSSDFYSIVKFLHFSPFDDFEVWQQWIGTKFPNTTQTKRLQAIGKALLLRRTKLEIAASLETHQKIPEKTVEDVVVTLKEDEREVYDHIHSFLKDQMKQLLKDLETRKGELQKRADAYVAGGRPRKQKNAEASSPSMATLFAIILRCRQAAVLPALVTTMLDEEDDDFDEEFDPAQHLCSLRNPVFDNSYVSGKLERLFEDLQTLRNEARSRGENMDKCIVVSQWTTLLSFVDMHLRQRGFTTISITGKTPIADRTDIMMKFNSNKRKPEIMLLSLTAGGCGLNLIGANRLFFLDIHWNPQLELQAQDRIHRFGQTKPVKITRYISEETIETRVLDLQEQKLTLANGLLTGASGPKRSGAGLGIAEMRKLFDL